MLCHSHVPGFPCQRLAGVCLGLGLLLLYSVARGVVAQPRTAPGFEHISTEQGLSFYAISSVLQDRQGFLWIGTQDGLNRYDGYAFTAFKHDPADSTSLSDSYVNIRALYEDQRGALWIGTRDGLNRRDPATGRFKSYKHDPADPHSLSHDNVLSLCRTRSGMLWVGTENGLNRYDAKTDGFVRYLHGAGSPEAPQGRAVTALLEDRAGLLWAGTTRGLHTYDVLEDRFTPYRPAARGARYLNQGYVFTLYEAPSGSLWIGTWGSGLFRLGAADGSVTRHVHHRADPYTLPDNKVTALYEDRAGTFWVGTWGGGLSRLDRTTGRFTTYASDPNNPRSLSDNLVSSIIEDRTGLLWVGTWDGLNKVVAQKNVTVYTDQPNRPMRLSSPRVSAVYEDADGALWIGTRGGGLNHVSFNPDTLIAYQHDPQRSTGLSHDDVTAIRKGRDGALWVGTLGGGLNRFDPVTRTFTHYRNDPGDPYSLSSNRLYSVYEDRAGNLWAGTVKDGLNRLDPATGRVVHYRHDAQDPGSLSHNSVWPIYEDHTGALWVGTLGGGLNRFDPVTRTFTHYRNDPGDPYSLSGDQILTINEDRHGILWVGTLGGGLNRFDRQADRFSSYTERDGLPHNNVTCILPDEAGNVWLGTTGGVARFEPDVERFTTYGIVDERASPIFEVNACQRNSEGTLFFGNAAGLVVFHPDSLRKNVYPPPVAITGFELFNEPVRLDSSLSALHEIRLPYDENFIAFRFAALDFTAPSRNEYAYMLEGVDKGWAYAGSRRYAGYPNLDPGRYTFRVKASSNDGLWNEEGASVRVLITPPFWRTWWAYTIDGLLLAALIAGMVMGYGRWQTNRLEKDHLEERARQLAQLDEEKTQFFANISHEFRTPLTLIMGPLKSALKSQYGPISERLREQLELMLRNSERLLRLINQILDLTRLEAGTLKLEAHPQDLNPFVQRTTKAFIPLADLHGLMLTCTTPVEPCMACFDAEYLEQILANLLSNALKFTPRGGQVHVTVCKQANRAEVAVRDTGIGIPADKLAHIFDRFYQADASSTRRHEGTGIGLALTKELVMLHGGVLTVESVENVGSTFTIGLPLRQSRFSDGQVIEASATEPLPPDAPSLVARSPVYRETAMFPTTTRLASRDDGEAGDEDDRTTVLVVDDHADVRTYVRSILEPAYRVLEAENGTAGLACAQKALPDLIVADVMMPEMDGFALSRALKQHPATDCIPVVLLTARAATEDELEGLETGADDYVRKPFEAEVLRTRIQNLIGLRQRLRERYTRTVEGSGDGAAPEATPETISPFLKDVRRLIEAHLHEPAFNVEKLADAVGLSYSRLYARLREEASTSPSQLIRTLRLERAAWLLEDVAGGISEVAYAVGFNSLSYFDRCFREHFGMTPSDYGQLHAHP